MQVSIALLAVLINLKFGIMAATLVVGGTPAKGREFPDMARLGHRRPGNNDTKWFCGGCLISERFVLTAAHCLYSEHGAVNRVRLGELDFSSTVDDAQPEDFDVQRHLAHPSYDWQSEESPYNDIGLIELSRAVIFSPFKLPACLPSTSGDELTDVIAAGWGSTSVGGPESDILQKVTLQRHSAPECERYTRDAGVLAEGLHSSSQLCAGSELARDTCLGDSGGPLLTNHTNLTCIHIVVGVTSFGLTGCGTPGVPAIYTRVHHYENWIRSIALK